jgi:aldehyde:ferredoxin oxidoreductase
MIDPATIEGKASMFVNFEDRLNIFDTLVLCRFFRDLYPWETLCEIIQAVTGMQADEEKLKSISASISDTVRSFNLREGLTRDDDRLPGRLYREALETGHRITEAELETMRADYYRLRGWDEYGRPKMTDNLLI